MSVAERVHTRAHHAAVLATLVAALAVMLLPSPATAVSASPDVTTTSGVVLPVVDDVVCRAAVRLSAAEQRELVDLSDATSLRSLAEGRDRMERITQVLADRSDRRGIVALYYRDVLRDAVPALGADDAFDDPVWATRLGVALFTRYLDGLHASLTGATVPASWQPYYEKAADCEVSPGRVALAGLDAHVALDLPESVSASGAGRSDQADYRVLGEIMADAAERVGVGLRDAYGADVTAFFRQWARGEQVDAVAGRGAGTTLVLSRVQPLAFELGLGLSRPWTRLTHRFAMRNTFTIAERVADDLAARGVL